MRTDSADRELVNAHTSAAVMQGMKSRS